MYLKLLIIQFISLVIITQSLYGAATGIKHALLIGIEDYSNTKLHSLKGTVNDLHLISNVLIKRYDFKEEFVTILTNEEATHTKVEQAFKELEKNIKKGDFVYIQYSGHGSYTRDLNKDELGKYDQTWVTYGSRSNQFNNKDNYDILDDELNEWLIPIFNKTPHVILVSDSCHSGSVTRGEPSATRAAAIDSRDHPLGKLKYNNDKYTSGIRIGSASDKESAGEFQFEKDKVYGLFTWKWAEALQQARPGETWGEIFKKVSMQVTSKRATQHPQIAGKQQLEIFGSHFNEIPKTVTIKSVSKNGEYAVINSGFISGVTIGSEYRLYDPEAKDKSKLASLTVVKTYPFKSQAKVKGKIKEGNLFIETLHAYNIDTLKVFISSDFPDSVDKTITSHLKSQFITNKRKLSAFELVEDQKLCQIVLYVLRPKKHNKIEKNTNQNVSLPQSSKNQQPEVWVLSDNEQLIHENLKIPFNNLEKGTSLLIKNLRKIAKIQEIKLLASGNKPKVNFITKLWVESDFCDESDSNNCKYLEGYGHYIKKDEFLPHKIDQLKIFKGSMLSFNLTNKSKSDYYAYFIDITSSGEIIPLYPTPEDRSEDALLRAGQQRDYFNVAGNINVLYFDAPGEETVKLIVTKTPIDISLIEQKGFLKRGLPKNPLEQLLANAAHAHRGRAVRIKKDQWGTFQYTVYVADE